MGVNGCTFCGCYSNVTCKAMHRQEYLNCQVASNERMACLRLFLEDFAILAANWCGNVIPSCCAMNSSTLIICGNQKVRTSPRYDFDSL